MPQYTRYDIEIFCTNGILAGTAAYFFYQSYIFHHNISEFAGHNCYLFSYLSICHDLFYIFETYGYLLFQIL